MGKKEIIEESNEEKVKITLGAKTTKSHSVPLQGAATCR
jgi:hypothetical protein